MVRSLLSAALVAAASPAVAQSPPPESAVDDSRIVCRKIDETGSLVRKQKLCFTRAEWDRIAESQRRGTLRMIEELASKSKGE